MKRRWYEGAWSLLYPFDVQCLLCKGERQMGNGSGLCQTCLQGLQICAVDGRQTQGVYAPFTYEGTARELVRLLKFHNVRRAAIPLAQAMAAGLQGRGPFDALVPVPLHTKRQRERGYNQCAVLCRAMAQEMNVPVAEDWLLRAVDTPHQVGLSRAQRQENVKGAFVITRPVPGQRVLLVDDVWTTGATCTACAQVLQNAGAKVTICTAALAKEHETGIFSDQM